MDVMDAVQTHLSRRKIMRVDDVSEKGPLRAHYYSLIHLGQHVMVVHEAKVIPHIHRIVKAFNPELIIELGTSWGGMTLVLHECNTKAELHSYDINCPRKPEKSLFNNVTFHLQDILTEPLPELVNLCKDKRRKFLYCDNGDKIKEVKWYGSQLNIGDMMGIHDFHKEIEYHDATEVFGKFKLIENDLFRENNWSTRLCLRLT